MIPIRFKAGMDWLFFFLTWFKIQKTASYGSGYKTNLLSEIRLCFIRYQSYTCNWNTQISFKNAFMSPYLKISLPSEKYTTYVNAKCWESVKLGKYLWILIVRENNYVGKVIDPRETWYIKDFLRLHYLFLKKIIYCFV